LKEKVAKKAARTRRAGSAKKVEAAPAVAPVVEAPVAAAEETPASAE